MPGRRLNSAAVLVTSRVRLSTVPGSFACTLEPMGTAESHALLAAVVGGSRDAVEPDIARTIVEACAGLPLALRIAGTRLASRPHWPAARLARRLADPAGRVTELRIGELDVQRTPASPLRRLSLREREFIASIAGHDAGAFTASATARSLALSEDTAEELLERLVEGAVLEMASIDATGEPRYRFHELQRLVAVDCRDRKPDRSLTRAG
nr:NB-ARC domain-containing protein [Streptomyces mirabilis]